MIGGFCTHSRIIIRAEFFKVKKFMKALPDCIHSCRHATCAERDLQSKGIKLKSQRNNTHLQLGFTLIELMVVLVIIGVLAALIVPNVLNRADDARVTAARTDVNNLMQALKLYRLDNQRYPSTEQGLAALVKKPAAGPEPMNWKPYLDKLPNDPWGRPYQYMNPGLQSEVDVLSFGADGQAGGEGKNADIGSWQ
jgi:general secretion pathway protein G